MHRADEDEYRQFVLPRLEPLRRMAFLLCREWHTADDLVSITLGKLYRRWHRAREASNLDAYVRAILTHAHLQVHLWLDRGMVDACVVTIGMSVDASDGGPPLNVEQLTKIAENPAITLYP